MKRRRFIMMSVVVLALIVGIYIGNKIDFDELKNNFSSQNKKTLAVYIEGDDGEYVLSSSNKFPTEGYALNLEKSACTNGGKLSQNPETKAISMSTSNKSECNLYFEKESSGGSNTIIAKANDPSITDYNLGNPKEMFVFEHPATEQTEALTDYRYIGSNPNNYIDFNDETWRIIGVFIVETENGNKEQLMKIIRDESIGSLPWDSSYDGTYSYTNEWSTALLKTLLNGDYYNTDGSFTTKYNYNLGAGLKSYTLTVQKGLNSTARNQIANVKWYLGGYSGNYNDTLGGPDYYAFERGTTVYSGRSTNIIAKVGIMYPSEYIYTYANGVDNICYTEGFYCVTESNGAPATGWLYNSANQWTLSPFASYVYQSFYIAPNGRVGTSDVRNGAGPSGSYTIRPTVYLNSNVTIVDGDGSQSNPYKLSN